MTPINAILEHLAEMCPIKGELKTRKTDDGDTIVSLPNGRFRRIRCARSLKAAYRKTARFPAIQHCRVEIGTPLEWETSH
jgi:hypothetical protein